MRVSKKFPIAVHTLLLIAYLSEKGKVTSDMIAQSTGTNAVTVRNIFSELKASGLIHASAGKFGGVALAKEKEEINLWDIYCAVETDNVDEIFKFHDNSSSFCPVGKNIYRILSPHVEDAVHAMKLELEQVTLAGLTKELEKTLEQDRTE